MRTRHLGMFFFFSYSLDSVNFIADKEEYKLKEIVLFIFFVFIVRHSLFSYTKFFFSKNEILIRGVEDKYKEGVNITNIFIE